MTLFPCYIVCDVIPVFQLKPDTIVQVWNGDASKIGRVTNAGLRALFSSCWYLDYIGYGQDWDKYYRCEQIGKYTRAVYNCICPRN